LTDDARNELNQALGYDPDDANIRLDLADIELASGNDQQALEHARAVLAKLPEHRRAKELIGIAMFRLGSVDQAKVMLDEALGLNPEPARVLYYLGRIDEMQGRTMEAIKRYRESAEHMLGE